MDCNCYTLILKMIIAKHITIHLNEIIPYFKFMKRWVLYYNDFLAYNKLQYFKQRSEKRTHINW